MTVRRADIIAQLQTDILRLQGFKHTGEGALDVGLGPIQDALPNASFPRGAVHEFLAPPEDAAPTSGFMAGLLAALMEKNGAAVWISAVRSLFPPALKTFGIQPDRIIFIDLQKEKDVVWAMEEALKCGALRAVVGEVQEISFNASRRLQLAVEQSQVTGFVLRRNCSHLNATACVSRWKITSLPSVSALAHMVEDLPGIGYPTWRVELLRIRNGKTGIWDMRWVDGKFESVSQEDVPLKHALLPSGVSQRNTA